MVWFGAWLALGACLRDVSPGPDLGACAAIPEGTYEYGEAGIGTCIAGPSGMTFFEQGGTNYLAVTNADPFREYRSGSVLVIDWDALATRLDGLPAGSRTLMDEIDATALEILDDDDGDGEGSNPFLGAVAYLSGPQALLSPGRYSEDGDYDNAPILRASKDDAWVVDTSGIANGELALAESLELEDDPLPVVASADGARAYVGNLSDHSVSVLDVAGPDVSPILTEVDVAPGATTSEAPFADVDASGSFGEVSVLDVVTAKDVVEDDWTLTYVEQTVRLYVPAPIPTDETLIGVKEYSTGDLATYDPSPRPVEAGLGVVTEPFVELGPAGLPVLWYSRPDILGLYAATATYDGGVWYDSDQPILGGAVSSPSVTPFLDAVGFNLYVELRDGQAQPGRVALSTSTDHVNWDNSPVDVLTPPEGVSYENPFVALDGITGTYRMWLSIRDGGQYDIATAESADGVTWSEPVVVLPHDGTYDYASPSVAILEGPRYAMWASRWDGALWETVFTWSYDGVHWRDPTVVLDPLVDQSDVLRPPRTGVFVNFQPTTFGTTGGWRLEGGNSGVIAGLLHAGQQPTTIGAVDVAVAHGHVVSNDVVPDRRAAGSLVPGSAAVEGARERLYATAFDVAQVDGVDTLGSPRVVIFDRPAGETATDTPSEWELLIDGDTMDAMLGLGEGEHATDPLIAQDDAGWVLFYAIDDGETARLARATSDDGINFTPVPGFVLPTNDGVTFDSVAQLPHSVEVTDEGVRVWYTGVDGDTIRIGSITAADLRGDFAREPGPVTDWRLGLGELGAFDGEGVRSPLVFSFDGETHLYYAGWDGGEWRLGHRVLLDDGSFSDPRRSLVNDQPQSALTGRALTYADFGVDAPVLLSLDEADRSARFAIGGRDELGVWRVGQAILALDQPDVVFPQMRFPTAGDQLEFSTNRGGAGVQVVELAQTADDFTTNGIGMSNLALDEGRGLLYVTTKLANQIYVIDVRDDSSGSFVDRNYLDLEAVLQIDTGTTGAGFRDVLVAPGRNLLYLTQRSPDALVVVDASAVVDDAYKQLQTHGTVAVLPIQGAGFDAGADNNPSTLIGGDGMALSADESKLFVAHFRGNGLSVFDLDLGAWGTETKFIQNVGENPHLVRISPDGRWAVIANYVGEVEDQVVSSNLAVVDLDPASENYLEIVTWLVNK